MARIEYSYDDLVYMGHKNITHCWKILPKPYDRIITCLEIGYGRFIDDYNGSKLGENTEYYIYIEADGTLVSTKATLNFRYYREHW